MLSAFSESFTLFFWCVHWCSLLFFMVGDSLLATGGSGVTLSLEYCTAVEHRRNAVSKSAVSVIGARVIAAAPKLHSRRKNSCHGIIQRKHEFQKGKSSEEDDIHSYKNVVLTDGHGQNETLRSNRIRDRRSPIAAQPQAYYG